MNNIKFDFNDISLIPEVLSDVKHRKDINILDKNGKLPLFVSPMDTVIDESNYTTFMDIGLNVCIPRGSYGDFDLDECFISYGLDEIDNIIEKKLPLPKNVLIDVANGHSIRVYDSAKKLKDIYPNVVLMVGNIANPLTYKKYSEIGVDYIRVGIGAGHACTTSANSSIHYPMASLIKECFDIKQNNLFKSKIVADGGFKNFDDINKALGLGADYVMLGNIINKSIESCAQNYIKINDEYFSISNENAIDYFNEGVEIFKLFRGMSTKDVQRKWGKKEISTSEGIVKINKVEYKISGWVENFVHYLRSAMSYQGVFDIKDFIGMAEYVFITQNAYNRFNK